MMIVAGTGTNCRKKEEEEEEKNMTTGKSGWAMMITKNYQVVLTSTEGYGTSTKHRPTPFKYCTVRCFFDKASPDVDDEMKSRV